MSELILINNKKIFSPNIFVKRNTNIEKSININNVDVEIANSENIERVKRVVEKYNRVMEQQGKEVKMNFDEEINRVVIKIFDKETSKLVYEFPYKEIRHLIAMLQKFNDTMFNEIA